MTEKYQIDPGGVDPPYHSISPNIKSHLELQREISLTSSTYSLIDMNMFAWLMTLQGIKETKHDGQMDVKTLYPTQTQFAGGIIVFIGDTLSLHIPIKLH